MNKKDLLSRIVDQVVYLAAPLEIILFGSYASGRAQNHSDIDLLIVADQVHKPEQLSREIKDFIAGFGVRSDVILRSRKELEREVLLTRGFLYNALKKSRKIYEKSR